MPSSAGTKVSTDPKSHAPNSEPTGEVLSDSLASESLQSGGGFAAGQSASAMKQSAHGTTSNVTDTHSAMKLNAAPDSQARRGQESRTGWGFLNEGDGEGKR
ncbi:hypothetical protein P152DRAFT_447371 [Eremomyces bilateralis CBS 781.70]|uniref:Uncharacterized protein n=1 Tax=Eremomyces bilateralis CBS 781.70 TaxID=1392243 RepID=A0A6G1GAM5_9PEZI|nr:uncharacterized protein P152DRAFT_447371 [Eremomyces bilateralis CBS 781.70]KAF1815115.1 hypothetical protein P152DRAFT_447371 [Eremomyces bilateralis CBS 781.70]